MFKREMIHDEIASRVEFLSLTTQDIYIYIYIYASILIYIILYCCLTNQTQQNNFLILQLDIAICIILLTFLHNNFPIFYTLLAHTYIDLYMYAPTKFRKREN